MNLLLNDGSDTLPLLASVVWGTLERNDRGYLFPTGEEGPRPEAESSPVTQ